MLKLGLLDTTTLLVAGGILVLLLLWTVVGIPWVWSRRINRFEKATAERNVTRQEATEAVTDLPADGSKSSIKQPKSRFLKLRYLEQFLFMAICSGYTVVVLFLTANHITLWYASWDDLFGKLDNSVSITTVGNTADPHKPKAPTAPEPKSRLTDLQRNPLSNPALPGINPNANGQWITAEIDGQGERGDGTTLVYLPPSYMKNPNREYPVLIAIHGVPGNPDEYPSILNADTHFNEAVKKGSTGEAIIVAPSLFPKSLDTECMDVPGAAVETWATTTLPQWIKTNLRVLPSRDAWATEGFSAGGYCSALLAMRHPDIFGAAIAKSGYFEPQYAPGYEWDRQNDPNYDLGEIAATKKPDVKLFVVTGQRDRKNRQSYLNFKPKVQAPTSLTVYEIQGSTHRWEVYRESETPAYEWLGQNLRGFAPVSANGQK
ncbi:alpha/beta hydrolase [Arcanobacterium ihumii]|uniref:alpha/beta hydrolase n=1 Tax=Arcanobacterium ihumii TaxID=2138162 RepID=UPI000F52793B|nr:alpha/beta hydrolase-fold protein [Arcanobacterium ihumii]